MTIPPIETSEGSGVPNKGGRPEIFKEETALRIITEISTSSKSLKTICNEEGMPCPRTIISWLNEGDKEDGEEHFKRFLRNYARAKEQQADFLAEEIIDISDDGTNDYMTIVKGDMEYNVENKEVTSRSKLRVEARKWIASKLKPKKYSDRIDLNHEGGQTIIVKFEEEQE